MPHTAPCPHGVPLFAPLNTSPQPRPPSPSQVTLFVYLNTLPEGVGHTEFPQIGLSVRPSSSP